jgi:hypothetical protein
MLKEKDHLGDPGLEAKIILKCILKEIGCKRRLDSCGSEYELVASSCGQCNELHVQLKMRYFLTSLLKDCSPLS